MTGEKMWQDYCLSTNTDINTKHDTWKFCGGGEFADQLANLVLSGTKTATASTRISYETEGEELPQVEKEGHIVIQKGRTNIKYYVKDYEKALFTL